MPEVASHLPLAVCKGNSIPQRSPKLVASIAGLQIPVEALVELIDARHRFFAKVRG
jgi:hypothetical protein